jgi:hypothetical protein
VAGVVAVACAGGLAALALVAFEPIASVEVAGARHLAREAAAAASGLAGVPVFQASAAQARAALLRNASLREARVEIALPSSARVTLTEREAAGRWVVGASEWFIDADGMLFGSIDPTAAPALRVRDLRTPARTAGERIDAAVAAAALRLARVAPGELRADANAPAVRIEGGPNGIVLASGAGWEIRFGGPDRIEDKLAAALIVLRERRDARLEYVDVRTLPQVVVSPPQ